MNRKIVIALTGASGSIYGYRLLKKISEMKNFNQIATVGYVLSDNAVQVWNHELKNDFYKNIPGLTRYDKKDFKAPFASGSAQYDTLIICPCSMGTLGRIAHGISDELITRTADVMLKERRRLILVVRDTPLNLIHINNMKTLTECGAIICPASPSFYSLPENIEELVDTVINRVLQLAGFETDSFKWMEKKSLE